MCSTENLKSKRVFHTKKKLIYDLELLLDISNTETRGAGKKRRARH